MKNVSEMVELTREEQVAIDGGLIPLVWVIGAMGAVAVAGATTGYVVVKAYLAAQD
jgi:lactobin A/cerein 7B family class IIb bacteriocin